MYYCRQYGVTPVDRPRTPDVELTSERYGDAVLDDYWQVGNLHYVAADREDTQ